ncbi:MAG: LiaF domain-containing protein [Gemmatimonadaceae bacterium]
MTLDKPQHAGTLRSLDEERQRSIDTLSRHFANDALSIEELERRIERVYREQTVAGVRELTRDLPDDAPVPPPGRIARAPDAYGPTEGRIVSVMTQTARRGAWQPPSHLDVWGLMSELTLDLTQAQFPAGVTEIHLHALMTSVKIIVPPGIRVVSEPTAFMAEVADDTFDPPAVGSGAPVLRISGFVMMAELKITVRTREQLALEDG